MNSIELLSVNGEYRSKNGFDCKVRKEGKTLKASVYQGDKIISSTASVIFYHKENKEKNTNFSVDSLPMTIWYSLEKDRIEITRDYTEDDLIVQTVCFAAIQSNPEAAKPYDCLASTHINRESKERLYLKAIACDRTYSSAFRNLALLYQGRDEVVKLLDEEETTVWKLLEKAIQLDPKDAIAITKIADYLNPGETYILPDGKKMTQNELYIHARGLDDTLPGPYFGLARQFTCPFQKNAKDFLLVTGRQLEKKQLTDIRKQKSIWSQTIPHD